MEIFKDLFPLEDRWGKDGVFTPTNIVKDMIDLLPDSIWNPESTFIDISCKTGAFLAEIYTRLDTELSKLDEYKDPVKRRSHILNNQLFGLALRNDESLFFSRRNVFGDPFSDNIDVINAGNSSYLDLVKQKQYSIIETQLKGKFGRMKFDVVVGNPPYNNDIYLDFVTLGHRLSTQYTLMITPAKWQAKGGRKNEDFRTNIVPYISEIAYYPNEKDIFNISLSGGLSYFLIDKVNENIQNRFIKIVRGGDVQLAKWRLSDIQLGFGLDFTDADSSIIDKVNKLNENKVTDSKSKFIPKLSWNTTLSFSGDHFRYDMYKPGSGYYLVDTKSKEEIDPKYIKNIQATNLWQVVRVHRVNPFCGCEIYKPREVASAYVVTLFAGSRDEAISASSYYSCKLIWWLVYRFFNAGTLSTRSFSFVPDPGKFDHIFTDEELYKKYGLTDDEIKAIESVIKERKQ